MKSYCIDLESKPQDDLIQSFVENIKAPKIYKDEEKIKEYIENAKKDVIKKMSVDVDYAEIKCIGIKEVGGEAKIITIEEFVKIYEDKETGSIIGYNIKKFDIPLLIRNGIKKGVVMPFKALHEASRSRYGGKIIDLMDELCFYGDWKSLDTMAQIYLGVKKTPIDFETCTQEELEKHCIEDCELSCELYLKFYDIFRY